MSGGSSESRPKVNSYVLVSQDKQPTGAMGSSNPGALYERLIGMVGRNVQLNEVVGTFYMQRMNTEAPLTKEQIERLRAWGYDVLRDADAQ